MRKSEHEAKRRLFLLQIVQRGLAGLMADSVRAPLFAAALATPNSRETFRVGGRPRSGRASQLAAMAWIRHRYYADADVLGHHASGAGGLLVFATGILIGSS